MPFASMLSSINRSGADAGCCTQLTIDTSTTESPGHFGTRMAATGVPMRTLQEWMGHRDIETTQRYADYAPSAHEAAFVAAAFAPAEPGQGCGGQIVTAG